MTKPNPAVAVLLVALGGFGTGLGFGGDLIRAFFTMVGLTALVLGAVLFSHSLK